MDAEVLDNLEDVLVSSDVGVDATVKIIKNIEERVARDKYVSTGDLEKILRQEVEKILPPNPNGDISNVTIPAGKKPYIISVVGVNGVGNTSSIGKLDFQF